VARGWTRATGTVSGSNAFGNAASDAGRSAYVPRIPGFRWSRGPWLASVKSPRWGIARPASARRPSGAGWAMPGRAPARGPHVSPAPPGFGQQWRHVSAPRAYPVSRRFR
jgi:hypothetical protein